jgi:uncharacterized iron-regulated membrane protein
MLRRALFQVHLWIGLATGLYITVVCATGAALVFRIDLQRVMHPQLFTPDGSGTLVDPVDVMESVKRSFPDDRVSGVDAPTTARPTYLAYSSQGNRFRTLLLDPFTARLLGELDDRSFVRTIQELHFDLLAGRTGRIVNGIGALCLLAMCITGVVIWWPGLSNWRHSLRVDLSRPWRRVVWELHGAIGVWTVLFIAMWAVTGFYFAFPSAFRSAVNRVSPVSIAQTPRSAPRAGDAPPQTWRALVDQGRRFAPGQHVARVVVPSSDTAAFLVMFSPVTPTPLGATLMPVYLDQYTGARLTPQMPSRTAGDVIMEWVVPLHVGTFGGNLVRVLWLVMGLSPPLLFATGFTMWWARVVRPRRALAQRGGAISASSVE